MEQKGEETTRETQKRATERNEPGGEEMGMARTKKGMEEIYREIFY